MKMKKFISLLATSLVLILATSNASAIPITGVINFTGGATVTHTPTEVTAVAFNNTFANLSDTLVTGDFNGLEGVAASFTDINVAAPTPYSLWTIGGFTFQITSIIQNSFGSIPGLGLNFALLGGNGIISSTNSAFEDTQGTWTITANGNSDEMSFSSTAVPSPAGTALLGLALLGFGFARRNKQA